MPKSDTATMIELAACGGQFMDILQNYQKRQNEEPNFDPQTEIYDLYTDLDYLCNKTKLNIIQL